MIAPLISFARRQGPSFDDQSLGVKGSSLCATSERIAAAAPEPLSHDE
jgi:hypothetical protein